jgi:hypothetical protein
MHRIGRMDQVGPLLGIAGGVVLMVGASMPWAVIKEGATSQQRISGTSGWERMLLLVGIVLVGVGAASLLSHKRLAIPQVLMAIAAGFSVPVILAGPVAASIANTRLMTESVTTGLGVAVSIAGAVIAAVGGSVAKGRAPVAT